MNRKMRYRRWIVFVMICFAPMSMGQDEGFNPFKNFTKAWQLYSVGDYEEARELTGKVVISSISNPVLKANYLYLSSLLDSSTDAKQAIALLEEARAIYQEFGNGQGEKTARLGLIGLYIMEDELDKAEAELDFFATDVESLSPGYALHLRARIALKKGDYEDALEFGGKSFRAFKQAGDEKRTAHAQTNLALYHMLLGHLDKGFKLTLQGQAGLTKTGDADQYYFTLINMIIYQRCKNGSDATHLISTVNERLEKEFDLELSKMLAFASNWECQ